MYYTPRPHFRKHRRIPDNFGSLKDLMLLEETKNALSFGSATLWVVFPVGGLAWMMAAKYAPTITPGGWHAALHKAGFSGVGVINPEIDVLPWPFSIMAVQAVDDRVQFLRQPLSHSSSSTSVYLDSVIILGSGSLESARMAEEVKEHLGRFRGLTTILNGLPTEAEAPTLHPMSTFINLVDIDSQIFKGMTAERMDGLKRLFELAKHILWITLGAQADEPYHMASIAFSRAMSYEVKYISLNHFDISDLEHNVSKVIAEYLRGNAPSTNGKRHETGNISSKRFCGQRNPRRSLIAGS